MRCRAAIRSWFQRPRFRRESRAAPDRPFAASIAASPARCAHFPHNTLPDRFPVHQRCDGIAVLLTGAANYIQDGRLLACILPQDRGVQFTKLNERCGLCRRIGYVRRVQRSSAPNFLGVRSELTIGLSAIISAGPQFRILTVKARIQRRITIRTSCGLFHLRQKITSVTNVTRTWLLVLGSVWLEQDQFE